MSSFARLTARRAARADGFTRRTRRARRARRDSQKIQEGFVPVVPFVPVVLRRGPVQRASGEAVDAISPAMKKSSITALSCAIDSAALTFTRR